MSPILIVGIGIGVVIVAILWLRLHAFLALILAALIVASLTPAARLEAYALARKPAMSPQELHEFVTSPPSKRVVAEFGNACARVGLLIALAAVLGKCPMESGSADRIVRSIIALLGERRAPIAFLFSGYLLSVPVFFDNVFLMMVPLCKALWLRTGRNYLLSILAVIAGGSMDLSLMPPGPGPSMAASALGVDKGLMMLFGAMVGGCAASVGMLYAVWIDRRMQLPVRDTAQSTPADAKALGAGAGGMPPLWMSLVPVFIPVLLIASATICNLKWSPEQIAQFPAPVQNWITAAKWLGEPSMALASGAAAGIAVLVWIKRPRREQLRDVLGKALVDGGQILLLIAAGGAFGGTLQHTGIGGQLQHWIEQYDLPVLPVAFLVTTLVRGAQGSATVAMITAAGMFSTLATKERLGFHPVYLALMIGCGSKPLAWMNDAGFWMIGKMSGMTESETLRTFSVQLTIEGIVGAVVVTIMSKVFPMIG